jgi:hypothetical protein
LLDVLLGRTHPADERSRRGEEIERLAVKSEATLARADRALEGRARLAAELDGAVSLIRRRR